MQLLKLAPKKIVCSKGEMTNDGVLHKLRDARVSLWDYVGDCRKPVA